MIYSEHGSFFVKFVFFLVAETTFITRNTNVVPLGRDIQRISTNSSPNEFLTNEKILDTSHHTQTLVQGLYNVGTP